VYVDYFGEERLNKIRRKDFHETRQAYQGWLYFKNAMEKVRIIFSFGAERGSVG
jgi:hypothetical protein